MPKPPRKTWSLKEALARLETAGIKAPSAESNTINPIAPLSSRIRQLLQLVKTQPTKATEMTSLIMYDITDDRVRLQVAKYLLKEGAIRIQKSVYLIKTANQSFQRIYQDLLEVNGYYDNEDSIILVPVNASDVRSMKLIGKNINIATITDNPNTLFF